ncbi:hypothetical protein BYT27DRAFT_7184219 [Phlegmacium glaucopus]|nr:hypothetical protein BYT27DRAFT_7184219 [Phlegmacium glaucopus]
MIDHAKEALFPSITAVYKQTGSGSTEAFPGHVQLTCLPVLLCRHRFFDPLYNVYSKRRKEVIIPGSQVVMLDC